MHSANSIKVLNRKNIQYSFRRDRPLNSANFFQTIKYHSIFNFSFHFAD